MRPNGPAAELTRGRIVPQPNRLYTVPFPSCLRCNVLMWQVLGFSALILTFKLLVCDRFDRNVTLLFHKLALHDIFCFACYSYVPRVSQPFCAIWKCKKMRICRSCRSTFFCRKMRIRRSADLGLELGVGLGLELGLYADFSVTVLDTALI